MTRPLVAIQMDRVETLKPKTDSTLLLGMEAMRRGYDLCYYTPKQLSLLNGVPTAQVTDVQFFSDPDKFYKKGETRQLELQKAKVVLMRQDPPFDMEYITATHILERLHGKTLVSNDPASVRNAPEKLFLFDFPEFLAPTLISAEKEAIAAFRAEHKDVVIKPLYGYAGHNVFRLREEDGNLNALLELFFSTSREPVIVQKFLPEIKDGDRRIMLIDGEFAGMMGRMPAAGEIRANFRVGGSPAKAELSPQQKKICEALGPELKKRGLLFVGIDVIGDFLTEINVTCPTGIPGVNKLTGQKLESLVWDAIEKQL